MPAAEPSSAQSFLDVWAAVGPIIGAVVGGTITWFAQRSVTKSQQEAARSEGQYRERKAAYMGLLRIIRFKNDAITDFIDVHSELKNVEAMDVEGMKDWKSRARLVTENVQKASGVYFDMLAEVTIVGSEETVKLVLDLTPDLHVKSSQVASEEDLRSQSAAAQRALSALTYAMRKDLGHPDFGSNPKN